MKLLTLSDMEVGFIYSPMVVDRFFDVDMIIGCGDLPYYYLEYVLSMLNVPLYYVNGNHASKVEFTSAGERTAPWGAVNLHQRVVEDATGLLMAGLEGCLRYNNGPHQYTQVEYWAMVLSMAPILLANKIRFGRYLDVFITHAPPWEIHDQKDPTHQGIKAFRWLINVFQPALHFHGHIHIYRQDTVRETIVGRTHIINTFGYRETNFLVPRPQTVRREAGSRERIT